jgi:hypothetical protein
MSITFVKFHGLAQVARIRSTIPPSANDLTLVSANTNSTAFDPIPFCPWVSLPGSPLSASVKGQAKAKLP